MSNFPLPYSSIQRGSKRKKAEIRVGKVSGKVRLFGLALEGLRKACFDRDRGRCMDCKRLVYYAARYQGDPEAYDMAHIISRGAGGSDALANVETLCHKCHMRSHTEGVRG